MLTLLAQICATRSFETGGRGDFVDEEVVRPLAVRILMATRAGAVGTSAGSGSVASGASGAGSMRERVLHVEVTDEADPFFLYTLDVGEEDFHELKRDQVEPMHLRLTVGDASTLAATTLVT